MIRVIEILLLYARKGADIIRLDAVTFLWASPGTSCANLEETHLIVKIFRDILDLVAPHVSIITVKQTFRMKKIFHTLEMEMTKRIWSTILLCRLLCFTHFTQKTQPGSQEWAEGLNLFLRQRLILTFLTHMTVWGLMAVKDILSHEEIKFITQRAREHGGYISYKTDKDGFEVPYEINVTWFNALCREDGTVHINRQVKKFIASRAIALTLQGVPGIYLHSLFWNQK